MTNTFGDICEMMGAYGQSWLRRNPEQASLYLRDAVADVIDLLCAACPPAAAAFEIARDAVQDYAYVDPAAVNDAELFRASLSLTMAAAAVGVSMGFPMDAGWRAMHEANMGLVDRSGGRCRVHRDAEGDIIPPEGWEPANLAAMLAQMFRSVDDHAGRNPGRPADAAAEPGTIASGAAHEHAARYWPAGYPLPEGAAGVRVYGADRRLIGEWSRAQLESVAEGVADPFTFCMGNDAAPRPYTLVVGPHMTPEQLQAFKVEWARITANQNQRLEYVRADDPTVRYIRPDDPTVWAEG